MELQLGQFFRWSGEVEPDVLEKRHVFLSHASDDKESYVYPFAEKLKQAGITYWLDDAEVKWGEKIASKINNGLAMSDFVVVFLTKAFIGRNWAESELFAALSIENEGGRCVVLPIVIGDPINLLAGYPLLKSKKYKKWDDGLDVLVAELHRVIFPSNKSELGLEADVISELDEEVGDLTAEINLELIINDRGKLCLLHDKKLGAAFGTIPFFAGYHIDKKQLEIMFNTGFSMPINFVLSDEIQQSLLKEKRILMVRMNNNKAVEGFDVVLVRLRDDKIFKNNEIQPFRQRPFLDWFNWFKRKK